MHVFGNRTGNHVAAMTLEIVSPKKPAEFADFV
jgi:hypothetical protein